MSISSFGVCSNDLDRLFVELVKDLPELKGGLISFRCIVPSESLKVWLTVALCEKNVPLMRTEILVLEDALAQRFSSKRTLLPRLISFLSKAQEEAAGQAFFRALGEEVPLSRERIVTFAKRYLVQFAQKVLLDEDEWFRKHGFQAIGEAFGQKEEKKQFYQGGFCKSLQEPTFLFGFSSLHAGAFARLLHTYQVKRLYVLSPSMLFWGDQCSDTEIRQLLKKNPTDDFAEAYLPYLLDRQKFLGNSGLIGREFLNFLEDLDLPVQSLYKMPEEFFHNPLYQEWLPPEGVEKSSVKPTLLEYVKADLLLLVGKREAPEELKKDSSLEIHAAYTPVREVEALKEALFRYFGKDRLQPASVLVLATDVKKYLAPFEEVFGGGKFLYRVWGKDQEELSFLSLLVDFISSQAGSKELLPLLRRERFLKSFGFPKEDRDELIAFFERSDCVSWREKIRKQYLEERGIPCYQQTKTFEQMYEAEIGKLFCVGEAPIKLSFLAFFAKVDAWIKEVETVVSLPLHREKIEPMGTWVVLFQTVLKPFFDEQGSLHTIEKALLSLSNCPQEAHLPFSEMLSLFVAESEAGTGYVQALSAPIILAEFGSFQPFPAEVVAILGVEEGSLPKENDTPLQYIEKLPPRLYPSSQLHERYAFIDAILSAKRLFIGYQAYAFELRDKVALSPVVEDLVTHLDANFLIAGEKPSVALRFQHSLQRRLTVHKTQAFHEPIVAQKKVCSCIDLSELQKTAKNPLLRYIQTTFGARDEWEETDSIFIKNFEVKRHLEEKILGKLLISEREHALALKTYTQANREALEILQEMGLGELHPLHIEITPTVNERNFTGDTMYIPAFEEKGYRVQGTWKGLVEQGLLLFLDTWATELFQKWPEYVFRSFLAKKYGIPFEESIISIKDKKRFSITLKDPETLFSSWISFSQVSCQFPFPFSRDIVKLLLKKPTLDELVAKVGGESYRIDLGRERIESLRGMWEDFAHMLYSDLFVREET